MRIHLLAVVLLATHMIFAQEQPDFHINSDNGDAVVRQHTGIQYTSASSNPQLFSLQAGDEVEGDFHISPQFEPTSGNGYAWVAHRNTDNISIVDVFEGTVVRVLETGDIPGDIAFTDQYALVACLGSRNIWVYNLSDYSLHKQISVDGQPINVEISKDQSRAVVCLDDIDAAVILDMNSLDVVTTIQGVASGLASFSFITSNTRGHYAPSGVALSPDGSLLASGAGGDLLICETSTGSCTTVVEVQNALKVRFTEDGNTLVCVTYGTDGIIHRVHVPSRQVESSVQPGERLGWANGPLAMNADGSRILVPGSNKGLYIRMDQGDFQEVTTNSAVFWTATTDDQNVAVVGGFNTYLMDMSSGDLVANAGGISTNTGAISGDGGLVLAMDPMRRERAELYIATDRSLIPTDPVMLGSPLEADATYSVTFTPDGKRLLAVNSLSGSVSVIDVEQQELEAIIPLSWYEVYHIAVSPDSKTAVIGERLNDQASIIDLENLSVTHEILTRGDRPDQSVYHPGGDKVYIMNAGSTDNISVVDMTQSPPRTVKNIVSGNMGISWINYGIRTNLALTDDGSRGVLATPFDDEIQIIDTENDEIIKSIPTIGFPLHTVLSDEIEGRVYAAVTLRNEGQVWIGEDVLGDILPFGGLDIGGAPTQLDYNPQKKQFGVISNEERTISMVDPTIFEVVEVKRFPAHLTPIAVKYSENGNEFVVLRSTDILQPHEVWVDDNRVNLPNIPSQYMDVSADGRWIAVPGIHSDEVYLINTDVTSNKDAFVIRTSAAFQIYPNPATDRVNLKSMHSGLQAQDVQVEVHGLDGRIIRTFQRGNNVQVGELSPGSYVLKVLNGGRLIQTAVIEKL